MNRDGVSSNRGRKLSHAGTGRGAEFTQGMGAVTVSYRFGLKTALCVPSMAVAFNWVPL